MYKIKQYIFNHKIFSDLHREMYMKSFKAASDDLEATRKDDIEEKAKELANKMLSDMLSPIDEQKIISVTTKGLVYIGGELAEESYLMSLKSEAEMIESTNLWSIMYATLKKHAENSMFVSGETLADMQKGKTMLFTLATQNKIVQTLKSYQQKKKI
jgi:hypothetical protein